MTITSTACRTVLLAALGAAALSVAGCSSTSTAAPPAHSPSPASGVSAQPPDTTARRVVASFKAGAKIDGIAAGAGWIWAVNANATVVGQGANGTNPALLRIDPATNAVSASVDLPSNVHALLVADGVVHIGLASTLVDVDPATMRITGRYPIPGDPQSMVPLSGALWLGFGDGGMLARFDEHTHAVTATVHMAAADEPRSLIAARGSIWATLDQEGRLARIDPSTARIAATYPVPDGQTGMLSHAAGDALWMVAADHVVHIDPATGASSVLRTAVPGGRGLIARGQDLWVVVGGNRLFHVDASADRVVESVSLAGEPVDMVDDGGTLWIASLANNVTRVNTL